MYTFEKNILSIDGKEIKFEHNIEKVLDFSQNQKLIVILEPYSIDKSKFDSNNVCAVNYQSEIIWKINKQRAHPDFIKAQKSQTFQEPFCGFNLEIVLCDYEGHRYFLNAEDGSLEYLFTAKY